ncbi:tyrosine-type recombinase/integrase [Nonomuraea turcica]|uniref:tyrosine-type recombinase/integrase n=1 Tax=Nonomuraea sp. G32 TaxID=3067274 RepID=UPI00273CC6A4|nr:tyrosine-type recombinase/integrase [Nonomuraea sp. G32]MDP4511405.1 tyrosine-type recombinase/integrase [Nonomuraea sp. G32]
MAGTRRKPGLLGPQVEGYRVWLEQRGYTAETIRNMLTDLGRVGRWLEDTGLTVGQLDEEWMAQFRSARHEAGQRRIPGPRAMAPLLTYLREIGITTAEQPPATPLETLLQQYRAWMIRDRGLAAATVLRYSNTARRFLGEQATIGDAFTPAALTGTDVNAFLLRECDRVSAGSAKGRVAELRSLLRFLYLQGITASRLGSAVPAIGGWRLASVPPTMTAADVQSILDGCDRSTPVGIRDYAIMILVARLGLRSIEVTRLELHDVDWRAGELIIRGKAGRQDRLPLPVEVGEALVAYLSSGRIPQGERRLFLTCRAPRRPIRADLVGDVVERACHRVSLPAVGPHRLRHAVAGELLRRGAGLSAISQILRHQDLATTALYAKVDLASLRQVAQPWPAGIR